MAYYIQLFSPETHETFKNTDKTITGLRDRKKRIASDVKIGDKLICYVTKLSRWTGVLKIESGYFEDNTPIFYSLNDPFTVRFKISTEAWLPLENSIPIHEDLVWLNLSFTKNLQKTDFGWTTMIRGSLRKLQDSDGKYLETIIEKQLSNPIHFPLDEREIKKLRTTVVKTHDSKQVSVIVPTNEEVIQEQISPPSLRESLKVQALIAEIGEKMNFKIWIPKNDRQRVEEIWQPKSKCVLDTLPLNYDDVTLSTIENIDILWIKGRSIVRAFEVEHTTSIYSGILRMADLMALQPNLNIKAHIVAPIERRGKVVQEISRPVFAFLENGPLSESCSFISYDNIRALSNEKQLKYMSDSVLEEYAEYPEESDI